MTVLALLHATIVARPARSDTLTRNHNAMMLGLGLHSLTLFTEQI